MIHTPKVIVYVDDNALLRETVSALLDARGHRVCLASNATQALHIVASIHADTVIFEQALAGMNGLALARALRADGFTGRLVVFSSVLTDELREAFGLLPVDALLEKPCGMPSLADAV